MAASMISDYKQYFDELDSTVDSGQGSKVREPNWVMKLEPGGGDGGGTPLTSSKIKGFEEFCYIYDLSFLINRSIEETAADSIKPDGGLVADVLKVVAPSSFIDADINLFFYNNSMISKVVLHRIVALNATEKVEARETYTFNECFITSMLTRRDVLAIGFRYSSVQRDTPGKNEDGSKKGQKSAKHDFISSISSSESKG